MVHTLNNGFSLYMHNAYRMRKFPASMKCGFLYDFVCYLIAMKLKKDHSNSSKGHVQEKN